MTKLLLSSSVLGAGVASYFWGFGKSSPTKTHEQTSPVIYGGSGKPVKSGSSTVNPQGFYKYGFPGPIHDLHTRQEFISCYDRAKRNPYWVVEHLTKESLMKQGEVDRKKSIFKEDEAIPVTFRSRLRDYFRSGYDRGHQAPAADAKFNQEAMNETFFLSNISPQVGEGFNRDYWAHLEYFGRQLTDKFDSVRIMTGPLYLPKKDPDGKFRVTYEMIGNPPTIAVPTHFFKLFVGETNNSDKLTVGAFVLPNDTINNSKPLTDFIVPIEALEISSGLTLLPNVPETKRNELCKQVKCELTVREFPKKVNQALSPPSLPGK